MATPAVSLRLGQLPNALTVARFVLVPVFVLVPSADEPQQLPGEPERGAS